MENFQKKSKGALIGLTKGGVTTILVSHNLNAIKDICARAIWLDGGKIRAEGDPDKVVEEYLRNSEVTTH